VKRNACAVGTLLFLVASCEGGTETIDSSTDETGESSDSMTTSTESGSSTTEPVGEYASYFPLVAGATWTYEVAKPGEALAEKSVALVPDGQVAGAFRFDDTNDDDGDRSSSLLERDGTKVWRTHKDILLGTTVSESVDYDPGFIRVDDAWAELAEGTSVTEDYVRHSVTKDTTENRSHTYTLVSADEEVVVPAGTFRAMHIQRFKIEGATRKDEMHFWWVKGVGKVRELKRSNGAEENLVAYDIPVSRK
jgi:hypothetical protein